MCDGDSRNETVPLSYGQDPALAGFAHAMGYEATDFSTEELRARAAAFLTESMRNDATVVQKLGGTGENADLVTRWKKVREEVLGELGMALLRDVR